MQKRAWLLLAAAALGLGACSTGLPIDTSLRATGQDSRVRFIVLHYTSENRSDSLRLLTQDRVSAHYLITDEPVRIFSLVDENRRAWHAGQSQWFEYPNLNAMSIGIEIVNAGPLDAAHTRWEPYSSSQISMLAALLHDIQSRHHVSAWNIVAHSDIAPLRKSDPGPAFPWQALARQGLGRWYDEAAVARRMPLLSARELKNATYIQGLLSRIGYPIVQSGIWDPQTRQVIRAFQMHYRPAEYSGRLDRQTLAIAEDLARQMPAPRQ